MAGTGTDIALAKEFLLKNELVAIPTETVYGLAANGLNADAVLKIYEAKNRPSFNPLILHVPYIQEAKKLVEFFPPKAIKLAEQFWPGPLTIVLKKKRSVPDIVSAGLDTIGVRVPDHPLTLELLRILSFPLAAPSANPSNYVSPTTPQHVQQQLGSKVAYILDGGNCTVGIESTIVKVVNDEVFLLRSGGLELEKIESVIGAKVRLPQSVSNQMEAPGMMASHYAPEKKLLLGNIEENILKHSSKKIGILSFKKDFGETEPAIQLILSPSGDLHEAARNLFSYLRKLDESEAEIILAEPAPHEGLGRAINDRLHRAAK